MPSLPWRLLARYALLGTVLVVSAVLLDVADHGGRNPVSLIQPGTEGPSAQVVRRDFPDVVLPEGLGHDGQQFYAVARAPMHLDAAADQLDRPRYRLQRPLLPWLAWMLHPTGGGTGLIWAMFAVNVLALFAAALAAGALAVSWRGPPWVAALVPLVPVGYVSLRISVADVLALALLLGALLADVRGRPVLGLLAATGAVLSKESAVVVLVGWALTRRSRSSIALAVTGAVAAGAWWAALRLLVEHQGSSVVEFGAPLRGLAEGIERWAAGEELWAAAAVVGGVALALLALATRRGHPLTGALVVSLLFVLPLNVNVVGLNLNGTRTLGPLTVVALLALVTPRASGGPVNPS